MKTARRLSLSLLVVGMLNFLTGCLLEQPGVKDASRLSAGFSGAYVHTGKETSCTSCHEKNRPAPKAGVAHGGGGDCVSCHKPGTPWLTSVTAFNHNPLPTSCANCHSAARPIGLIQGFDHAVGGMGDCVSCHSGGAGKSWTGGTFSHSPTPNSCIACHTSDRPAGTINNFNHANGGMGDCVNCHKNPGVQWSGGLFSHVPPPATCSDCHLSDRPTTLVKRFMHSVAGTGDCKSCHVANVGINWTGGTYSHVPAPNTCTSCHTADRPTGVINNFNHANGGMGDCITCHKSPGVRWSGALFSHTPAPSTCIDCHLPDRPTGVVGGFDHAKGGTGDCKSCHTANIGVNWTGGKFSHSPAPANCIDCHLSKRPTTLINRFMHSVAGTGDCKSCHLANIGVNWTGGVYSHTPAPTTCLPCHSSNRPTAVVNGFSHTTSGTGDCVSCHKSPGVRWTGGLISHSPVPSSCNSCHTSDRPTVANYPSPRQTVTGHYGTQDCYSCHRAQTATITAFNWNHYGAGGAKINTCLPCHKQKGVNEHGNNVQDCKGCHSSLSSWNK